MLTSCVRASAHRPPRSTPQLSSFPNFTVRFYSTILLKCVGLSRRGPNPNRFFIYPRTLYTHPHGIQFAAVADVNARDTFCCGVAVLVPTPRCVCARAFPRYQLYFAYANSYFIDYGDLYYKYWIRTLPTKTVFGCVLVLRCLVLCCLRTKPAGFTCSTCTHQLENVYTRNNNHRKLFMRKLISIRNEWWCAMVWYFQKMTPMCGT